MPLKSKKQARYLASTNPSLFREFEKKTLDIKRLPEKIKKPKKYDNEKN